MTCLGELEVDYHADVWADHDERCHGTIDTDTMRKENPEGFTWSCCNEDGRADGCQTGPHVAKYISATRRRVY
jgi:hypothetical protein